MIYSTVSKDIVELLHTWLPPLAEPQNSHRVRPKARPFTSARYVGPEMGAEPLTVHWALDAEFSKGAPGQAFGLPRSWLEPELLSRCAGLMVLLGVYLKDSRTGVLEKFSAKALAHELGVSPSTVGRQLELLANKGLIAEVSVPEKRGTGRALLCAVSPSVLALLKDHYEKNALSSFVPVTTVELSDERRYTAYLETRTNPTAPLPHRVDAEEAALLASRILCYRNAGPDLTTSRGFVDVATRGRWFQVLDDESGWAKGGRRVPDFDLKVHSARKIGQHFTFVPLSWAYLMLKRKANSCFAGQGLIPNSLRGLLLVLCHRAGFRTGKMATVSQANICTQMGLARSSRQRVGQYLSFLHACGVLTQTAPAFKGDCARYELHAQVGDFLELTKSKDWLPTLTQWAHSHPTHHVAGEICPQLKVERKAAIQAQQQAQQAAVTDTGTALKFVHKGFGHWDAIVTAETSPESACCLTEEVPKTVYVSPDLVPLPDEVAVVPEEATVLQSRVTLPSAQVAQPEPEGTATPCIPLSGSAPARTPLSDVSRLAGREASLSALISNVRKLAPKLRRPTVEPQQRPPRPKCLAEDMPQV